MGKVIDLTGKRFGRLTVIERAEDYIQQNGRHRIMWLCKCDCGNYVKVMKNNLYGHTRSCGCLAKETASKVSRKYNKYDLSGEYGVGYTFNNEPFYFDLEDYDKIKDYCWCLSANGYVVTNIWENKENTMISMHRLIMNFPKNMDIDHKRGKTTKNDNRKSNLRIVKHSDNLKNVGMRSNNTSGATGINFDRGKWVASIKINGIAKHLGRFDNFEDAVKARKDAEEKYFGEYSYDNSQKLVEGSV